MEAILPAFGEYDREDCKKRNKSFLTIKEISYGKCKMESRPYPQ